MDFPHLWQLHQRGAFWVSRSLERFRFKVVEKRPSAKDARVKGDVIVAPLAHHTRGNYPGPLRLAEVEIDGRWQTISFLTNSLSWTPSSVAELYRCRWQIEVFFLKQLKQTVQPADFLGHPANAVKWQVWTALLVNLLMRFLGLAQPLGPQLRTAVYFRARRSLVAPGSAKFAATLWDSPRRYPMYRPARPSVVACLEQLACGTAHVKTNATTPL